MPELLSIGECMIELYSDQPLEQAESFHVFLLSPLLREQRDALREDLEWYLTHIEDVANAGPEIIKYKKFTAEKLKGFGRYAKAMRKPSQKTAFLAGARCTLREIKNGLRDNTIALNVEDQTCSAKRLKKFVNGWKF